MNRLQNAARALPVQSVAYSLFAYFVSPPQDGVVVLEPRSQMSSEVIQLPNSESQSENGNI